MAAAPDAVVLAAVAASPLGARYGTPVDRESAYELLQGRARTAAAEAAARDQAEQQAKDDAVRERAQRPTSTTARRRTSPLDSFLRSAGTQLGRELTRTILGTLTKR